LLGETHMIAGALAAAAALSATGAPSVYWIPAMAAGAVAGLLPDLDMPDSTAGRAIPGFKALHNGKIIVPLAVATAVTWALPRFLNLSFLGDFHWDRAWIVLAVLTVGLGLASWIFKDMFWHRGPTHSLLMWLLFTCGIKLLWSTVPWPIWMALSVGYLSHSVIDSFNPTGVAWLWPLSRRKFSVNHSVLLLPFRPLVVTTGSFGEIWGWRPVMVALTVGLLLMRFANGFSL